MTTIFTYILISSVFIALVLLICLEIKKYLHYIQQKNQITQVDFRKMATNCVKNIEPYLKEEYSKDEVKGLLFNIYLLAEKELKEEVDKQNLINTMGTSLKYFFERQ